MESIYLARNGVLMLQIFMANMAPKWSVIPWIELHLLQLDVEHLTQHVY